MDKRLIMEYEAFYDLVQDYLLPMFPNTQIHNSNKTGYQKDTVVINNAGLILAIKSKKTDDRRVELIREIPFDLTERQIAKSFVLFLEHLENYISSIKIIKDNLEKSFSSIIAHALNNTCNKLIQQILREYDKLADFTYEGNRLSLCCCIKDVEPTTNINYINLLKRKHGLALTNAYDTYFTVAYNGQIASFDVGGNIDNDALCPYRYSMLSQATKEKEYCICLNRNGEILVIENNQLVFTKRRGKWQYYANHTLYNMIKTKEINLHSGVSKKIYQSLIDVSFKRCGGCIGIVEDTFLDEVKTKIIKPGELFPEPRNEKANDICALIKDKRFMDIDRRIRMELLGIDGAIILDKHGNILTVGSIINITEKSEDGARTAAAKTLSNYGISVKVSMDGEITLFRKIEANKIMSYQFA
jgi:hypothetical protein